MPVVHHGKSVIADPKKPNEWLRSEAGGPIHIVTDPVDLTSDLNNEPLIRSETASVDETINAEPYTCKGTFQSAAAIDAGKLSALRTE
jgi:hypothetical protein